MTQLSRTSHFAIEMDHLPHEVTRQVVSCQNKMARYLFDISCLKGIDECGATRRIPPDFFRTYQKALTLYDESVQFLLGYLHRQGFTVQCTEGCAHCCCHMPSGISIIELLYLYHGMHRSGAFPVYFRRCLEAEELWVEILRSHRNLPPDLQGGEHDREAMLKNYNRLEQYCPFLQHSMCQLYLYRPIACRMHFSLSPPAWCHPSHFQNPNAVRFNLEPGNNVKEALERLDERLKLKVSDLMACGLLELTVNVMKFERIEWKQ